MYLIVTPFRTEQVAVLRTDSIFLGWIFDTNVSVFRIEEGRFQKMRVVQKKRPSAKQYGVLYFAHEWESIKESKDGE
jgi:hypothetical protein